MKPTVCGAVLYNPWGTQIWVAGDKGFESVSGTFIRRSLADRSQLQEKSIEIHKKNILVSTLVYEANILSPILSSVELTIVHYVDRQHVLDSQDLSPGGRHNIRNMKVLKCAYVQGVTRGILVTSIRVTVLIKKCLTFVLTHVWVNRSSNHS